MPNSTITYADIGLAVKLTARDPKTDDTSSYIDIEDQLTPKMYWSDLKRIATTFYGGISRYEINGMDVHFTDSTPLCVVFSDSSLKGSTQRHAGMIEVVAVKGDDKISQHVPLQGTSNSQYFVPDEKQKQRAESSRYLAKVKFSDGTIRQLYGHSYDRLENVDGKPGDFVDQLATSKVKYVFKGLDDQGKNVTVELSSQQCILVDPSDHQFEPYILLSASGRKALDNIQPLGFLTVNINSNGEQARVIRNGDGNINIGQLFTELAVRGADSVRNAFTSGAIMRLLTYFSSLMFRYIPLALLAMITRYSSPLILSILALIVLSTEHMINQLEEIVTLDMPLRLQPYMMKLVGFFKFCSASMNRLNLDGLGTWMVDFGIGNDRPNLIVIDEDNNQNPDKVSRLLLPLKVALQDLTLAIVTLVPNFFTIYNYEIVKREGQVKQQRERLMEDEAAEEADQPIEENGGQEEVAQPID